MCCATLHVVTAVRQAAVTTHSGLSFHANSESATLSQIRRLGHPCLKRALTYGPNPHVILYYTPRGHNAFSLATH
jgi:hypothetical protein